MYKIINLAIILVASVVSASATASEYSYQSISNRHSGTPLNKKQVAEAKIQGECMVGLKNLNFKKKGKFDPVAEWTSFRTTTLLQRYSPCQVLIIVEVAQNKMRVQ